MRTAIHVRKQHTFRILIAVFVSLLCSDAVRAEFPIVLSAPGIKLLAQQNGTVILQNEKGVPRLTVDGYSLCWVPPATDGGTPSIVTNTDGTRAIQVVYKVKDDSTGKIRIQARFTLSSYRMHLRYDVWGPDGLNVDGAMVTRHPAAGASAPTPIKTGLWTRDTGGGVPYEMPDLSAVQYRWGVEYLYLFLQGSNLAWQGQSSMSFPSQKVESGHFVAEGDIILSSSRPASAAALLAGRPLSLDLWTDTPFNLWDSSSKPLQLHTQTVNTSTTARPVTLSAWARDFNGKLVMKVNRIKQLKPGQAWNETLSFPAPKRGILFVEVQAKSGANTVFSRTNLAVLPPHKYLGGDDSMFGIAAFFTLPSEEAVERLLSRIGVRWLRACQLTPDRALKLGIRQNQHSNVPFEDADMTDPVKKHDWILQQLAEMESKGAVYWEFGNEINMSGGIGKGELAERYVKEYLIPVDELRKQSGAKLKLMSVGLAGGDTVFLDKMVAAGGWSHFDAVAIHPGRGNYTPDYGGDTWGLTAQADYWNFLGTIQTVKRTVAKYGAKPIFVTEAYAGTHPNNWWSDTNRHAAENVVLQYALAAAEGIRVMDYYQLHDSVWYDQSGVNPKNPEYYYGMLNRDLSVKPALLGYATIAAALDQAKFVRWLKFGNTKTKGLLFNTPRGPMSILWNRADGYVLNTNHKKGSGTYPAPEPWQDGWRTKLSVMLPAAATHVREIDSIGQERILPVKKGQVRVVLDGAPRIYYGLSTKLGQ